MPRATPQAPEERRRALIDAALPLLLEHGPAVTTRQIAEAAGVAEGTIFRYFATKQDLVREAVAEAIDPSRVLRAIGSIDKTAPLEARLAQIIGILTAAGERTRSFMGLLHANKAVPRPGDSPGGDHFKRDRFGDDSFKRDRFGGPGRFGTFEANAQYVLEAVADVLRPDLGAEAESAAAFIRALTFAGTMPPLAHPSLRDKDHLLALVQRALGLDSTVKEPV